MGYFNGHIALNWIFTICSAPNFECKRTYFTITSVSNDISNLNACICSHNAADSWDIFFFQAQIKRRNLPTPQIALPPFPSCSPFSEAVLVQAQVFQQANFAVPRS